MDTPDLLRVGSFPKAETMQINVYGTLRRITGKKTVRVDSPSGTCLRAVLDEFVRQYPPMQELLLDERGELRMDLPLFVNGRNPRLSPESIEMELQADDVVSLFSPISSGRMNVEGLRQGSPGEEE